MARITTNGREVIAVMKSAAMQSKLRESAERVLAAAKSNAPVASGDYQNSLHIIIEEHPTRAAAHIGSDLDYALLVEANTGNLARALDAR